MNTRFGCWARRAKPCLFAHLTTSVVTAGPLNLLVHGDESAVEDRRKPHRKRRRVRPASLRLTTIATLRPPK